MSRSRPQSPEMEMETSRSCSPSSPTSPTIVHTVEGIERLKRLYPYTDISQLPKNWSTKDKANFIILSEDGLKVHYKGVGKSHKDAAAVRATHSIPQSCLLYYYEVRIISKGRDGYMGIGLAAQGVNMHRLPGWDKQSYGYHGDDGHSFNSSGTGQPYGPTFTTGDVIGCGFNLIENKCFYTKNGLNLGVAFSDLAAVPLFPTVGLQTPGEELEANFGLEPFSYDIEQDMIALKKRITESINTFPVNHAEWQPMLHYLVQSWLIHNGYCSTAQVFSESTQMPFKENIQNIKQRLKIQQFVLNGKIGDAIALTNRLYPTVLRDNPDLLFSLKCRQFVEFVCGHDTYCQSANGNDCNGTHSDTNMDVDLSGGAETNEIDSHQNQMESNEVDDPAIIPDNQENHENNQNNHELENNHSMSNGSTSTTNPEMETILSFGKELNAFSKQLKNDYGYNETNKKMLEEAFHMIAYNEPNEPQLHTDLTFLDRETVCQQLNNAIVNVSSGSQKVPIETVIKHTKGLISLNSQCGAWILEKL
ncbi:hypothetical protein RDWZM_007137 [Blomia tropicalis]|uniref:Ran-binding protein 9 n=1 Tax=Blomia tropicalis TaxID=40697 RepID=A0A9Q0M8V8_BLOTA|nr:hypothetical protein RDWZM_007137 [Blomia tropicalis]